MKNKVLITAATLAAAAQVSAGPAMSVVTVNAADPMGYMDWAKSSGPAIGDAIDADIGGICLSMAGFYAPGELYYWHIFESHADAMAASIYDDDVMEETAKLDMQRRVSQANMYSVVMAESAEMEVGDSFASWNLAISTDEPGLYLQQLPRLLAAARESGFDDVTMNAYATLTGPMAGDMLVTVGAPEAERLGELLDQLNNDTMGPILASMGGIRSYEHGFAMECHVVYVDD
jgi:hypothetical protein